MANAFKLVQKNQDSLDPNKSQQGLEKVVGLIGTYIIRVAGAMSNVFYGAYVLQGDKKASKIQKAVDRGLINALEELSNIDLCNLFNYLANNKLGKGFDPKDVPISTDPTIKKVKYAVQLGALQTQSIIDNYFAGGITTLELVRAINLSVSALINDRTGLNNAELRKQYPEVDLIGNFLNDKLGQLTSILAQSVNGKIPQDKVQEVIQVVNKIRAYCVAIQSLNNPAAVISVLPSSVQKDLDKLNKLVDPEKFTPFIYRMLKTCNKINNTCRSVLTYVSRARVIVKFAILIIRAINVIKAFFLTIPAVPVPAGAQVKISDIYQEKLKEQGEKKLLKVLKQILNVLDDIYTLVSALVAAITEIIRLLNIILLNIKSCNPELASQMENAIKELESTKTSLQKFIDEVDSGKSKVNNTFGGYTVYIVSEEMVDEGIRLRRRFGIARGQNGVIVVQSTPTFATLDQIIINEVKLLLVSNGYVKPGMSSPDDEQLVNDVSVYLENNNISNSIETPDFDPQGENNTDLNNFMNNLPGGKAFKKKIRKKLLENTEKMKAGLKNVDPNQNSASTVDQVK